jgi:hypothetical protein
VRSDAVDPGIDPWPRRPFAHIAARSALTEKALGISAYPPTTPHLPILPPAASDGSICKLMAADALDISVTFNHLAAFNEREEIGDIRVEYSHAGVRTGVKHNSKCLPLLVQSSSIPGQITCIKPLSIFVYGIHYPFACASREVTCHICPSGQGFDFSGRPEQASRQFSHLRLRSYYHRREDGLISPIAFAINFTSFASSIETPHTASHSLFKQPSSLALSSPSMSADRVATSSPLATARWKPEALVYLAEKPVWDSPDFPVPGSD